MTVMRGIGIDSPDATGSALRVELTGSYRADAAYPAAIVNVTNKCNLHCAHCFVYREGNPNEAPASLRDEMDEDAMLETLAGLRDRHGIRSLLWMGGEPMLKKDLLARGIPLFESNIITTNGSVPLVDFGPEVLYVVSLDGPPVQNDRIRGEGVYARVMRNLERLPEDFSSPIQVQCAVTALNQDHLEELVVALQSTRVGWMTFSFYVPRRDERGGNAWPDNHARLVAVREVERLKRAHPRFVRNHARSLALMAPGEAERVTADCPARRHVLPLYLEGDHFVTPFCCYGNDVDCERCGAWVVFHLAARRGEREAAGLRAT